MMQIFENQIFASFFKKFQKMNIVDAIVCALNLQNYTLVEDESLSINDEGLNILCLKRLQKTIYYIIDSKFNICYYKLIA